jgi:hypothetical protein
MRWSGPAKYKGMQALAAMCSHVPDKGEQMVRYYGFYSNVVRGQWKKAAADDHILCGKLFALNCRFHRIAFYQ